MATSASKRKQDEKHLKMLREIVALPHNKQCFDCHQRGPTYVNMTVGAFVCTSCSGILRGLNPPHRVKSISMATFSPDEMEFLRSRGNEFCRKVWLCKFNPSIHREPDSKDEQKIKDFMADKYEKKQYYTEGTEPMHEEARRMNTPPAKPDQKQLRSLAGTSLPVLKVDQTKPAVNAVPQPLSQVASVSAKPTPVQSVPVTVPAPTARPAVPSQTARPTVPSQTARPAAHKPAGFDLLGDLGGDPFAAPSSNAAPAPASTAGFADFSSFSNPVVTSPPQTTPTFPSGGLLQPQSSQSQATQSLANPAGPVTKSVETLSAADRYAALASLDTALGGGGSNAAVNWDGMSSGWSSGNSSTLFGPGGSNAGAGGATVNSAAGVGGNTYTTEFYPWYTNGSVVPICYGPSPPNPFHTPSTAGSASNPFGSSPSQFGTPPQNPATTPGGGNPFMGGGFNHQQQPQPTSFSQYQPTSAAGGFAQFPQPVAAPVSNPGFGVQNGFGTSTSQQGFGGGGAGFGAPAQFAAQANMMPGGAAQYGGAKMVQSPQQQQQFASWGQPSVPSAAGNPFMAQTVQQPVPPRGSSTNPFL